MSNTINLILVLFSLKTLTSDQKDLQITFLTLQLKLLQAEVKNLQKQKKHISLSFIHLFLLRIFTLSFKGWKRFCIIVSPSTLFKCQTNIFKLFWKLISKRKNNPQSKISQEIIDIIQDLGRTTKYGAQRIKGILKRLGFTTAKLTIQRYLAKIERPFLNSPGGNWKTFLLNHFGNILAVDFTSITNFSNFIKPFQILIFIDLKTRKIVHWNIAHSTPQEWVVRQLKEATPFLSKPVYLVHDNDNRFRYIPYESLGIKNVRTSFQAPNMNAYVERFMRTLKEDCLNHFLFFSESQLRKTLSEYIHFYNNFRPHQGIDLLSPEQLATPTSTPLSSGKIRKVSVLNGLHYYYLREAA